MSKRCWKCRTISGAIGSHHINRDRNNDTLGNKIDLCRKCHDLVQAICDKCLKQKDCFQRAFQECWSFDDATPPIHFRKIAFLEGDFLEEEISENKKSDFFNILKKVIQWEGQMETSIPKARGNKEFKKYQNGDKLTTRQAVLAKCADCMGYYIDGKNDCGLSECPLYPMSPYGKHPAFKSRTSPKLSTEHLKKLSHGRIRAKQNKPVSVINMKA